MIIGFTGTRIGMSWQQSRRVAMQLHALAFDEFHHGDCVGADMQAHEWVVNMGIPRIVIHPPTDPKHRAFCTGETVILLAEAPYISRNEHIVESSDIMIAAPSGTEVLRSGTWATIRYARWARRTIYIAYPDGSMKAEGI